MASALTKASRGQECTLQIHPHCVWDVSRTSPCHLPSGDRGVAFKSQDWWLVDGCDVCHSIIDGRLQVDLPEIEILKCTMRALHRTLKRRIDQGLIKVPKGC